MTTERVTIELRPLGQDVWCTPDCWCEPHGPDRGSILQREYKDWYSSGEEQVRYLVGTNTHGAKWCRPCEVFDSEKESLEVRRRRDKR